MKWKKNLLFAIKLQCNSEINMLSLLSKNRMLTPIHGEKVNKSDWNLESVNFNFKYLGVRNTVQQILSSFYVSFFVEKFSWLIMLLWSNLLTCVKTRSLHLLMGAVTFVTL